MRNLSELDLVVTVLASRLDRHDRELAELRELLELSRGGSRRREEAMATAKRLGVGPEVFQARPARGGRAPGFTRDRNLLVRALRGEGWEWREIADALGCGVRAIERAARDH